MNYWLIILTKLTLFLGQISWDFALHLLNDFEPLKLNRSIFDELLMVGSKNRKNYCEMFLELKDALLKVQFLHFWFPFLQLGQFLINTFYRHFDCDFIPWLNTKDDKANSFCIFTFVDFNHFPCFPQDYSQLIELANCLVHRGISHFIILQNSYHHRINLKFLINFEVFELFWIIILLM